MTTRELSGRMTRNLTTALRLVDVVGVTVARSVVLEHLAVVMPEESLKVTASWRPATKASNAPGMHTGAPGTLTATVSARDIVAEAGESGRTVDFLVLLDAQRERLAAEDAQAQAEVELYRGIVAIYKALGGGWEPETLASN